MSGIDELGVALAQAQDRQLAADRSRRLLAVRAALLADPRIGDAPRRTRWLGGALAFAMVAALVLGLGLWLRVRPRAELTFTVGDDASARVEALWIAAPDAPVEVAFSDGARLVLAQGSRARVDTANAATARVVLESGGITVVTREDDDREPMVVDAGPFALALRGGDCEVAWDGTTQRLGVVVHDGRVHVDGPGEQTHDLVAGQRIEISPDTRLAVANVAEPTAPPAEVAEVVPPAPAPAVVGPRAPTRSATRKPVASSSGVADWSVLARASKHREALAAAEAIGFADLCATLGAPALLQLADTARFAGKSARASEALASLRRRHPASDEAAVAAYTLGRIAAGARRPAEAAEQFATYLRERPKGSLAREALGRMLEAEAAAGQATRADATARRYLELYPSGPHADVAAARFR